MIRHDRDLASKDLYVRDEACARLADFWFCEHPDCDVYTNDRSDLDDNLLCPAHRPRVDPHLTLGGPDAEA